jgi:DNA helicase-2/ATP-dependent DNA helicase PcrA
MPVHLGLLHDALAELDIMAGLDDAQRAGVLAPDGLTVIEAGAGTGKTRTLTTRTAALLYRGILPYSIVAMTFTKDAAMEMRERALLLGAPGADNVRISTMHALSARILRRHWAAAGLESEQFIIAGSDEKRDIVSDAVEGSSLLAACLPGEEAAHAKERRKLVKSAMTCIDRWKENGLSVANIVDPERKRRSGSDEAMALVYLAYQAGMKSRNLIDFGDLILMTVELFEKHPQILAQEAGSIHWLMVDEWQDTNNIQLRFIRLLASHGANVTVVGDDDQSLYAFRGAIPRLMERTAELLPAVAVRGLNQVRLITNRRCTEEILAPANLMVDYNPRSDPKVLRSGTRGSPVTVAALATDSGEAEDIAKRVKALIAAGANRAEIAILGRTRSVLDETEKAFLKHHIPHAMQAGNGFLEKGEVQDVMAYLKLAINPSLDLAFERIAAKPTRGLGPSAVAAILDLSRAQNIAIHVALALIAESGTLKGEARNGAAAMGRHLAMLSSAFGSSQTTEDMLKFVFDTVGYLPWARKRKDVADSFERTIERLVRMAREQPFLQDFLADLTAPEGSEDRDEGVVHIGTLHGSKGLEWDHVFMPGFEDGIIPSQRAMDDAKEAHDNDPGNVWQTASLGGIEEERRLAHVGFTRARKSVHVSFAGRRRLFGEMKPARPSRLLHEAELKVPRIQNPSASSHDERRAARGKAKNRTHEFW